MSNRKQNVITKTQTKLTPKSSNKSKNKNPGKNERKMEVKEEDANKSKIKPKLNDPHIRNKPSLLKPSPSSSSRSSISTSSNKSNSIGQHREPRGTPPSSRVQKTYFFPTKQMYTNAVKSTQESSKNNDNDKKQTVNIESPKQETSAVSRPRTATLSRPSIQTDEYEDDFDSYESDFEEYASSVDSSISETSTSEEAEVNMTIDEEHKLDSGNFDLPETKHTQVLDNIKESVEVESNEQNRSNLTSLSDEGFEEGKLDRHGQFVNFLEAQRKQKQLKSLTMKHKRGEELKGMIKLDEQTFTVFEIDSIPYNLYIRKFGNNNTIQVSTQTGFDNVNVEIQTIPREYVNKWTQFPTQLTEIMKDNVDFNAYKQEYFGVGGDRLQMNKIDDVEYNEHNLKHFMQSTTDVILNLLEEKSQRRSDIEANSNLMPFTEGYITLNTKLPHLDNIPVTYANFTNTKVITIHQNHTFSLLCVWSLSDTNIPEYCIKTHGIPTCTTALGSYIYAGLSDGTLAVWDLNELSLRAYQDKTPPSHITNIDTGHTSRIVSLEVIESEREFATTDETCNLQVYSLDENGYLIIWTVIILQTINRKQLTLQQGLKYCFKNLYPHLPDLQCTNMAVNLLDVTHIFISTNYGQILHVSTTGTKANPTKYSIDHKVRSNCITMCPFSPMYILGGFENGNMVLFSRKTEMPLITLTNCDDDINANGVEFIEWSRNKPCVLYVKDKANSLHIWDLSISDIFPICTVPFRDEINFIKLSPNISKSESYKRSYMVIISNKSEVKLHILNKEHGQQSPTEYENNVRKFLNYVNRL